MFTLKAWQLITHPASSATYRRTTEPLSARQRARAGGFRWNDVTRMAWRRTREIADALAHMIEPGRGARVLFNNDAMAGDAHRFRRRLA